MNRPALAVAAALASAACATALPPDVEARVRAAVDDDRAAYPELNKDIAVGAIDDDVVFFQSNFTPESALGDGPLAFSLQASPRAFALGIDRDALHGVIGHELAHSLDYVHRSARGKGALLALLWPALVPEASTWERFTDLVAIDRGFGPRLLHYRVWLFRVLDRDAVRDKRAVYYSPLEIALLLDVRARCPAQFAAFLERPPRTARAIATRCP